MFLATKKLRGEFRDALGLKYHTTSVKPPVDFNHYKFKIRT